MLAPSLLGGVRAAVRRGLRRLRHRRRDGRQLGAAGHPADRRRPDRQRADRAGERGVGAQLSTWSWWPGSSWPSTCPSSAGAPDGCADTHRPARYRTRPRRPRAVPGGCGSGAAWCWSCARCTSWRRCSRPSSSPSTTAAKGFTFDATWRSSRRRLHADACCSRSALAVATIAVVLALTLPGDARRARCSVPGSGRSSRCVCTAAAGGARRSPSWSGIGTCCAGDPTPRATPLDQTLIAVPGSGLPVVLVLAYIVLALPFVYRALDAGLRRDRRAHAGRGRPRTAARAGRTCVPGALPNLRSRRWRAAFLTLALVLGEYTVARSCSFDSPSRCGWSRSPGRQRQVSVAVSSVSLLLTWLLLLDRPLTDRRRLPRGTPDRMSAIVTIRGPARHVPSGFAAVTRVCGAHVRRSTGAGPDRRARASWSPCSARPAAARRPRCGCSPASKARRGSGAGRRRRRHARARQPPGHRDGVPVVQPVPQPHRARQRGVRAAGARGPRGRAAREGRRAARSWWACRRTATGTRTRSPAASSSGSRWPGRWPRAAGAAARRAAVRARRQGPRSAARGDPAGAAAAGDHHALRHPRPGGGALDRRPGGGAQARAGWSSQRPPRSSTTGRRRRSWPSSSGP